MLIMYIYIYIYSALRKVEYLKFCKLDEFVRGTLCEIAENHCKSAEFLRGTPWLEPAHITNYDTIVWLLRREGEHEIIPNKVPMRNA